MANRVRNVLKPWVERVWTQQRQGTNGWTKGHKQHLGGFLGFEVLEDKKCLNHIKLCERPNVVLKREKLSFRDATIGELYKKKKEEPTENEWAQNYKMNHQLRFTKSSQMSLKGNRYAHKAR